jgi:uroporphyrinogen decarboxylase
VDLAALADRVPGDVLLMGNISPAAQFSGGSPDSIRKATLGLLHQLAPNHPNFIISSGCDIPPGSSWANIDAFFDAVTAFYQQQN